MGKISITHNINKVRADLAKKARNLEKMADRLTAKEAFKTHADLVSSTPRRWTGDTRRAWRVRKMGNAHYKIYNDTNVMFWLEEGTNRRTPKKSKRLFIPMRYTSWKQGGYKKGMKWSRDFVYAKSARGIKPLGLLPKQSKVTYRRLANSFKKSSLK